ncbi:class I SAM-dependent methyltransferase [Candidatus Woesearchaeota archaeon]|nr:class I SAM-dependent methyltransferase [Candidatus Woesearchaeota archaeon]
MKINPENEFLKNLIKLQYGLKVQNTLKKISSKVIWARGWPQNKKSFWNAEAFMWNHKIDADPRKLITQELKPLHGKKNLDLGCGSYSYIPSTGFDISKKMLDFNDNCLQKVTGDLENKLPFANKSFDSVTALFVLNYVKNYPQLLSEISRVLKFQGIFVAALYSRNINSWQRQKEVNKLSKEKWKNNIAEAGFSVKLNKKQVLWLFKCVKST